MRVYGCTHNAWSQICSKWDVVSTIKISALHMIYIRRATDANTCLGVAQFPGKFSTPEQVFASVAFPMYIIWRSAVLNVETTSHGEIICLCNPMFIRYILVHRSCFYKQLFSMRIIHLHESIKIAVCLIWTVVTT